MIRSEWEQGTRSRERVTGSRELGAGSEELGAGNSEQGAGGRLRVGCYLDEIICFECFNSFSAG